MGSGLRSGGIRVQPVWRAAALEFPDRVEARIVGGMWLGVTPRPRGVIHQRGRRTALEAALARVLGDVGDRGLARDAGALRGERPASHRCRFGRWVRVRLGRAAGFVGWVPRSGFSLRPLLRPTFSCRQNIARRRAADPAFRSRPATRFLVSPREPRVGANNRRCTGSGRPREVVAGGARLGSRQRRPRRVRDSTRCASSAGTPLRPRPGVEDDQESVAPRLPARRQRR